MSSLELQETPMGSRFGVSHFAAETGYARKVVGCRVGDVKTATGIRSTIGGGQHIITSLGRITTPLAVDVNYHV